MSSFTFTNTIPVAGGDPSVDQSLLLQNNGSITGWAAVDHTGYNVGNGGTHKKVTFIDGSDPGSAALQVVQYAKSVVYPGTFGTFSELFIQRDVPATAVQLTTGIPSVGANGYTSLPGGLIFQWGSVVAVPGGTSFTFPVAFPTTVFSVTLGMRAAAAQGSSVGVPSLTSVTVFSASGAQTVYVMAIGN